MQFKLILGSEFLKKSYARRIFHGWWKLAIAFIMILVSVCLGYQGVGNLGAFSVFGLSSLLFVLLIYSVAWFRQSKMIDDWIRRQGEEPVVYDLSDETVASSSMVGSTSLKWDAFSRLVITDYDTLLMFPRSGALTMPTEQVPVEAMEFLISRFRDHGKKVEDKRRNR